MNCPFDERCYSGKIEWLNSEYKEQKEFTNDERKVIELLDKVEWVARLSKPASRSLIRNEWRKTQIVPRSQY